MISFEEALFILLLSPAHLVHVAYIKAELSQRLRLSVVFCEMLVYGKVGTVVTEAGPEHLQLRSACFRNRRELMDR